MNDDASSAMTRTVILRICNTYRTRKKPPNSRLGASSSCLLHLALPPFREGVRTGGRGRYPGSFACANLQLRDSAGLSPASPLVTFASGRKATSTGCYSVVLRVYYRPATRSIVCHRRSAWLHARTVPNARMSPPDDQRPTTSDQAPATAARLCRALRSCARPGSWRPA